MDRCSCQHAGKMVQKRETVHDTAEWGITVGARGVAFRAQRAGLRGAPRCSPQEERGQWSVHRHG